MNYFIILMTGVVLPVHNSARAQMNTDRSFVATTVIRQPGIFSTLKAEGLHYGSRQQTVDYFDGLGRPLQTIKVRASPGGNDIIKLRGFDEFGREIAKYLPYSEASANGYGHIRTNGFADQLEYYHDQDTRPYALTLLENSPLQRTVQKGFPGEVWLPTRGHAIQFDYSFNSEADQVHRWNVIDGAGGSFGRYVSPGEYNPGQLYKTVTTDENGKLTIEFINKEGNLVFKKVQVGQAGVDGTGSSKSWMNTVYIYDELANLRCVIQPQGEELIRKSGGTINDLVLEEYCFRYEYDGRGRMIVKKTPAAGPTEMVYDIRDRLMMSRDANMKNFGRWKVHRYDDQNRLQAIELIADKSARETHQTKAGESLIYPRMAGEILQENFYDDYSWVNGQPGLAKTLFAEDLGKSFFLPANSSPEYARPLVADYVNTRGRLTGSSVKVLGTDQYLYRQHFYDAEGRLIQTRGNDISDGFFVNTSQYDFNGSLLRNLMLQHMGGKDAVSTRLLTVYRYDHEGRLLDIRKQIGDGGREKTVVSNSYDELGRLRTKTLGDGIERQDYEYHIRGWLMGSNREFLSVESETGSGYFGYELGYETNGTYMGMGEYNPQYNGNIGGLTWKSVTDGQRRKYSFAYDAANRLMKAEFSQASGSSGVFDKSAGLDFSVKMGDGEDPASAYDLNGNIRQMEQTGWNVASSSVIDLLSYNYKNNDQSNRLMKVVDQIPSLTAELGDFKDGDNADSDYDYDQNGNLLYDRNQGIKSIVYNLLNLPYEINFENGSKISFVYDAQGNQLKKTVVDNSSGNAVTNTWIYLQNFVYRNDILEFFLHEEGRARYRKDKEAAGKGDFFFDFFLKDHLGNIRMVLTEEAVSDSYPAASIEDDRRTAEEKYYVIQNEQVKESSRVEGLADYPVFENKVYSVHGGIDGQKTGLGIVLKVMYGDTVMFRADSYYNLKQLDVNRFLPLAIGEVLAPLLRSNAIAGKGMSFDQFSAINAGRFGAWKRVLDYRYSNGYANAFLNWVLFDEQFRVVSAGADPVQQGGGYKNHLKFVNDPIRIARSGYLYIFVSNRSSVEVYFDNLAVTHKRGPVLEETHYYPFGLPMAGISSKAMGMMKNTAQTFQEQRLDDELGMGWVSFKWRNFDRQIGRFVQVDPLADDYRYQSPYNFSENRVIDGRELEGMEYVSMHHYMNGNTGIKMHYKSTDKQINQIQGIPSNLYNSASFGPQGKGVVHYYYNSDGQISNTRWDNQRTNLASFVGQHGLYSGPGGITDGKGNYDFSFQPVDWADAIAKKHDMDYVAATSTGEKYAGYIEDVRTVQADKDMLARLNQAGMDIVNPFTKIQVDGVEKPYRTSWSGEMQAAMEGQALVIAALATYKQWKLDNKLSNDNSFTQVREAFSSFNPVAAAIVSLLVSNRNN